MSMNLKVRFETAALKNYKQGAGMPNIPFFNSIERGIPQRTSISCAPAAKSLKETKPNSLWNKSLDISSHSQVVSYFHPKFYADA